MKKKIFALVMTVTILISLFSLPSFADSETSAVSYDCIWEIAWSGVDCTSSYTCTSVRLLETLCLELINRDTSEIIRFEGDTKVYLLDDESFQYEIEYDGEIVPYDIDTWNLKAYAVPLSFSESVIDIYPTLFLCDYTLEIGYWNDYETIPTNLLIFTYSPSYDDGHSDGYKVGYDSGEESGYQEGYQDGSDDSYQTGYEMGYIEGEASGYDTGYSQGYYDGDNAGYTRGWTNGKKVGYDAADKSTAWMNLRNMIFSIFDAPLYALQNAFDFELFGINVGGLFLSLLGTALLISIVLWVSKRR